ncbi:hypothetical protein K439DRAFT_1201516 [Ramaria rubella]|nr:hypothetical protein K439DRAFT_1201516 [Ramaria rubella]
MAKEDQESPCLYRRTPNAVRGVLHRQGPTSPSTPYLSNCVLFQRQKLQTHQCCGGQEDSVMVATDGIASHPLKSRGIATTSRRDCFASTHYYLSCPHGCRPPSVFPYSRPTSIFSLSPGCCCFMTVATIEVTDDQRCTGALPSSITRGITWSILLFRTTHPSFRFSRRRIPYTLNSCA